MRILRNFICKKLVTLNEPKATQMRSVQEIRDVLTEVRSFIDHEATSSASTVMGRTSRFWKELFDERQNFPTVAEFLAFRHSNFAYGMADERQGSLEHERLHAARTFDIFKHSVSPAEVAQVEEPSLGAPFVFDFGGVTRSAAFWVNAATAHRVRQCVAETSLAPRPLHVLEIGAGWGATSYQLHHLLDIDSYTIVDLPQNLLLSTTYLRNTLPDRALGLIGQDGPELSEHSHKSIVGMLPGALPRLATKHDVILNSFSLQEMDLDTVQAYFSWIEQSPSRQPSQLRKPLCADELLFSPLPNRRGNGRKIQPHDARHCCTCHGDARLASENAFLKRDQVTTIPVETGMS